MTSPSITPGTPVLGPPPEGEPLGRAITPSAGETHDIVLGGVGFSLYRARDDSPVSETFGAEALDYTYAPVFVPRFNQGGDLGDDQQDFFMAVRQRDWSGGEGRKYFHSQDEALNDAYHNGGMIRPTVIPGEVRGGVTATFVNCPSFGAAGSTLYTNGVFVKNTGNITTNPAGDAMAIVEGHGTRTVVMSWSTDGGLNWTTQTTSSAQQWADCVDMTVGDDGFIYCLEGTNTSTQSKVHRIAGLSQTGTTQAWDNWTANNFKANCICYYSGGVYCSDSLGKLRLVTSAGGAGTTIKDFGGGVILQLLATPEGMYILYLSADGEYRVYLYSGDQPSLRMVLPHGWREHFSIETGIAYSGGGASAFAYQGDFMCWSEGVLYVAGMLPSRDYYQSRTEEVRYRTALYFYQGGDSGIIWQAQEEIYPFQWGGGGGMQVIYDGIITWPDPLNDCVMGYDPRTGGVFQISPGIFNDQFMTDVSGSSDPTITTALAGTVDGSVDFGASDKDGGQTLPLGSILRNTTGGVAGSERAITHPTRQNFGFSSQPSYVKRGWNYTTPVAGTFSTTGDSISALCPPFPPRRMVFDYTTGSLLLLRSSVPKTFLASRIGQCLTVIPLRTTAIDCYNAAQGTLIREPWVQSSGFDFDSSLQKYFRTLQVDADLTQFPLRTDEKAGQVFAFYRLDNPMKGLFDPFVRPTDMTPLNGTTMTLTAGGGTSSDTNTTLVFSSIGSATVGSLLVSSDGSGEIAKIASITGTTVVVIRNWSACGTRGNNAFKRGSTTAFVNNATFTMMNPITPGTRYDLNVTGQALYVLLVLSPGLHSSSFPISLGPILRKMTVRAAPIMPGYRMRKYQIAMTKHQRIANGQEETRTPHEQRAALEALIQSNTPITVSDHGMTGVSCMFLPENCKAREVRRGEFIFWVELREVL